MTQQQLIDVFADAIAFAEGFYVAGSRAARNNNPGNITLDITGTAVGNDGIFMVYATATDGWNALKRQIEMILENTSRIYNSNMTIMEIAQRYTTTQQQEWASNVAYRMGVPLDVPISSFLTTTTVGIGFGFVMIFVGLWLWNKQKAK